MLKEITDDINARMKHLPDSRCATGDEVRICWLVAEIQELKDKIKAAENCLVCRAIAPADEIIENTMLILKQ